MPQTTYRQFREDRAGAGALLADLAGSWAHWSYWVAGLWTDGRFMDLEALAGALVDLMSGEQAHCQTSQLSQDLLHHQI